MSSSYLEYLPFLGDTSIIKKRSNVIGRVSKKLKNGVLIELPNDEAGFAHVTEISDQFVENPLGQLTENQYVR